MSSETEYTQGISQMPNEQQQQKSPSSVLTFINSAALVGIVGWAFMITYQAGRSSEQLDNNTKLIQEINRNGTSGTAVRLDSIDQRLKRIEESIDAGRQEYKRDR